MNKLSRHFIGNANRIKQQIFSIPTLRCEMAAAIEAPGKLGEENAGKIIHTLLSRTEARTALAIQKLEMQTDELKNILYRIITMIDRGMLVLLQQFPILSNEITQAAISRGKQKHHQWRQLIVEERER